MAGIDNNTLLYLRGDSFKDLSANSIEVVNNGITINEDGKFGKCLLGNGSGNLVFNNLQLNSISNDLTIEFWVYHSQNSKQTILASESTSWNVNAELIILCYENNANTITFVSPGNYSLKMNISFNAWNHIAYVVKGKEIYGYVNGVLSGTTTSNDYINFNFTSNVRFGGNLWNTSESIRCKVDELRMSSVARYTSNFTPPTQPYNSITINKTNQTDTNIEFNIEKLGQETVNKVEVLVNGIVSETYTDNYDNINYLIDTELCMIGNNDITIRVTFDDTYTKELSLTHKVTIDELPLETPLLDTVERVKLLTKSKQSEKTMLSSILTSKNVEVSEEDKMSDLISKVELFDECASPILYLYKEGDECVDTTGGWTSESYNNGTGFNFVKNNTDMTVTVTATQKAQICTIKAIDLTRYSKIYFEVHPKINSIYAIYRYGVVANKTDSLESSSLAAVLPTSKGSKATLVLDISSINRAAYIAVYTQKNAGANVDNVIYNIWLQK